MSNDITIRTLDNGWVVSTSMGLSKINEKVYTDLESLLQFVALHVAGYDKFKIGDKVVIERRDSK